MGVKEIKVIVEGGKATPGPPIGPALGPLGINAAQVVKEINEKTAAFKGIKVPVVIKVDPKSKTFEIEVGSPPVAEMIKKELSLEKGHSKAWREPPIGNISMEKVVEIAKSSMGKMNTTSLKSAVKIVLGTALSMGVAVEGKNPKEVIRDVDEGKYDSILL